MSELISIQINLPWWIPPISEKCKEKYLGLELDKPYWSLIYEVPGGFLQTLHGLN